MFWITSSASSLPIGQIARLCSKAANKGKAAWAEFGQFVSCRIATMVMDQVIIWLGVSLLGPACRGFAAANGKLWAMGVKLFSQVIVILSNYVFSKVFIF